MRKAYTGSKSNPTVYLVTEDMFVNEFYELYGNYFGLSIAIYTSHVHAIGFDRIFLDIDRENKELIKPVVDVLVDNGITPLVVKTMGKGYNIVVFLNKPKITWNSRLTLAGIIHVVSKILSIVRDYVKIIDLQHTIYLDSYVRVPYSINEHSLKPAEIVDLNLEKVSIDEACELIDEAVKGGIIVQ